MGGKRMTPMYSMTPMIKVKGLKISQGYLYLNKRAVYKLIIKICHQFD